MKSLATRIVLGWLAIALGTLIAYAPVAENGFVDYDDSKYLTENAVVQKGLTKEGLRWAFDNQRTANFHPLTWLSHMLDVELFGMDAGAHHMVSVGIHALTACLLFSSLLALGLSIVPALLIGLLFALHPLRVESVAWAAERKDVLSGLFFALSLLVYARAGRARIVLLCLLLLLGLAAKSMLVTLPCVLLLLDVWPTARHAVGWPLLLRRKLPLFLVAGAFSYVAIKTQEGVGALRTIEDLGLSERVANAFSAYGFYAWKTVAPLDLAVFYPHPAIVSPEAATWGRAALTGLAVVLVGCSLAWILRKRTPSLYTGWFWFLGMLVPVLGIVQVGEQAFADRYAYLPTIGLYLAAVPLLWNAVENRLALRTTFLGLALVGVGALGWTTRRQVAVWHDSETLFLHAVSVTDKNYVAETGLALLHEAEGELEQARLAYERALLANPRYGQAHNNLGVLLQRLGQPEQAEEHLRAALEIEPESPEAWNNLGIWHARQAQPQEALEAFTNATGARPDYGEAYRNKGGVLEALGRLDEALVAFETASEILGDGPRLLDDRGRIHQSKGEIRRALGLYARALQLSGDGPFPLGAANNYAWILATHPDAGLRDGAAAVKVATRSVRSTGQRDPRALSILAAAHAEVGAFEEAVRWQNLALQRSGSTSGELLRQLESYRAEKAWRSRP